MTNLKASEKRYKPSEELSEGSGKRSTVRHAHPRDAVTVLMGVKASTLPQSINTEPDLDSKMIFNKMKEEKRKILSWLSLLSPANGPTL
jgi:hypothetical protein